MQSTTSSPNKMASPIDAAPEAASEHRLDSDDDREKHLTQTATHESRVPSLLSRFRTADSLPLTPPPDGGWQAWTMALMACLVNFNTWGFVNTFGVFQTYYVNTLRIGAPSSVSWIGSLHVFLVFAIGVFSGRATDAGYFHVVFGLGSVIYCVGLLALSFCDQYWQIILCHSIIVGGGAGLAFVPSMTVAASYFSHAKRPMALALVVCGSSTGGVVFPAVAQVMLPQHGFGWTIRTIFFVQVVLATVSVALTRPRTPPRKSGPLVEWAAWREAPYTLYLLGIFFAFIGIYIGFFYIGSYGRDVLDVSQATGIRLLLIMNGVGLVGRIVPNIVAERLTGPLNLIIPYGVAISMVTFAWSGVHSEAALWAWAAVQGLVNAGIQSLFPVVLTSLTDDPKKMGVRNGMGFATAGLAVLIGPPIAGALVQRMDGRYLGLQIFAGLSVAIGACFHLAARWARVGWDPRTKV